MLPRELFEFVAPSVFILEVGTSDDNARCANAFAVGPRLFVTHDTAFINAPADPTLRLMNVYGPNRTAERTEYEDPRIGLVLLALVDSEDDLATYLDLSEISPARHSDVRLFAHRFKNGGIEFKYWSGELDKNFAVWRSSDPQCPRHSKGQRWSEAHMMMRSFAGMSGAPLVDMNGAVVAMTTNDNAPVKVPVRRHGALTTYAETRLAVAGVNLISLQALLSKLETTSV